MPKFLSLQLDGAPLGRWQMEGFPDETVLVVPCGDLLYELGMRVMERPSHTQTTDPPRPATLDEVAELAWMITCQLIAAKGGAA